MVIYMKIMNDYPTLVYKKIDPEGPIPHFVLNRDDLAEGKQQFQLFCQKLFQFGQLLGCHHYEPAGQVPKLGVIVW